MAAVSAGAPLGLARQALLVLVLSLSASAMDTAEYVCHPCDCIVCDPVVLRRTDCGASYGRVSAMASAISDGIASWSRRYLNPDVVQGQFDNGTFIDSEVDGAQFHEDLANQWKIMYDSRYDALVNIKTELEGLLNTPSAISKEERETIPLTLMLNESTLPELETQSPDYFGRPVNTEQSAIYVPVTVYERGAQSWDKRRDGSAVMSSFCK